MRHSLPDTLALLERTPATLSALLRELPARWTQANEGGDTWTAYDIVGHLIHGERTDWIPRARIILAHGESRPFDAFDRQAQFRDSAVRSLGELLDEFARLRAENVAEIRSVNDDQLQLRGLHPALGVVTLSELLAAWVVHDLTHLHQLARVLAFQYRDSVGPFAAYLGVLQCNAHGA